MALFTARRQRSPRYPVVVKTVYTIRKPQPRTLADFLTRLNVLCNGGHGKKHPLPCRMGFIGESHTNNADPMAVYACPICNYREAYVRDFATGKPRLLFQKAA